MESNNANNTDDINRTDFSDELVIDWDEALISADNDEEFIMEILNDLMTETKEAYEEIRKAIDEQNFHSVMTGAHKIKGSAAYLCCRKLYKICTLLCIIARSGPNMANKNEGFDRIKILFEAYVSATDEVGKFLEKRLKK